MKPSIRLKYINLAGLRFSYPWFCAYAPQFDCVGDKIMLSNPSKQLIGSKTAGNDFF